MSGETTISLADDGKRAVEHEARSQGISWAETIRRAVASAAGRPCPRSGIVDGEPIVERVDELLARVRGTVIVADTSGSSPSPTGANRRAR